MADLCELLEWDSAFFDLRIARVRTHTLDEEQTRQVLAWSQSRQVDCLYFLSDMECPGSIAAVEAHGFGLKDVRLTYRRNLDPAAFATPIEVPNGRIRDVGEADLPILEAIAEDSYHESRFYFDQRFPPSAARRLYRAWVRNSASGWADSVLVLEVGGVAAGFITCHLREQGGGECGLSGLDPHLRGQGLGLRLYEAALAWLAARGATSVRFATQARNVRVRRLYQRLGFFPEAVHLWYHKWFEVDPPHAAQGSRRASRTEFVTETAQGKPCAPSFTVDSRDLQPGAAEMRAARAAQSSVGC